MIIQNNGSRKFIIDGLIIEPHKTYNITEEQYSRVKGFKEIKPLCVVNSQEKQFKKPVKKEEKKQTKNTKREEKKPAVEKPVEEQVATETIEA